MPQTINSRKNTFSHGKSIFPHEKYKHLYLWFSALGKYWNIGDKIGTEGDEKKVYFTWPNMVKVQIKR